MKVLAVDDSSAIRRVVAECLKSMGHEICFAEDGRKCLQIVRSTAVDLILMDIEMPDMNGLEATSIIRQEQGDNWFPIIFLTSYTDDESFRDGILAGGDAYLPKPLNPVRLEYTILAMERIYRLRRDLHTYQSRLLQANDELKKLSLSDALTGLANRRKFDQTLSKQFETATRSKSPLSLLLCDIDFFKQYNDYYGHMSGDRCLSAIAAAISQTLSGPGDLACRYGGEEFAVILPDTVFFNARETAEKIRQAVLNLNLPQADCEKSCVTLSLGGATYAGQFKSVDAFVDAADTALYRAKNNGRNRVEFL